MLATAAVGGGAYLLRRAPAASQEDIAAKAAAIGRANGLFIGYGDPASFYVPPYGPHDAAIPDGSATQAEITDVAEALDAIEQSLSVYPAGFYAALCRAIFLCGTLLFGAEHAGGTYGPAWIVLATDPSVGPDGIRETARLGVHHEFSSLLLQREPEIQARWQALLPAGWRPDQRSDEALRHDAPGGVHDGFLSSYGATSLENDFNTYAETAFGAPSRLIAQAAANPLVARKAALLLQAYAQRDARMEQTYRKLGIDQLAVARPAAPAELRVAPIEIPAPTIETKR
ncbi:hypothetical protein ACSBM8_08670 [Sphingomonas sp. ASY06-1R]|jgi:hypothetical protein|uniref:hypothetical protein n=1 Tax=Sphingomonas sp. ASY06-1R TaxID=3445771 RepID=UPI003FA263BF